MQILFTVYQYRFTLLLDKPDDLNKYADTESAMADYNWDLMEHLALLAIFCAITMQGTGHVYPPVNRSVHFSHSKHPNPTAHCSLVPRDTS